MPFFAVNYTYVTDSARLDEVRPEHRAYLATLVEQKVLRASGPLVGVTPGAALLIVTADDAAAVQRHLDGDPFQKAGLVARTEILEWNPVLGDYAAELG